MRTFLAGGDVVLPERVVSGATLVIEDGVIADVLSDRMSGDPGDTFLDATGCLVLPGFIDVHVHGAAGHDILDVEGVVRVAEVLPRWGVTAFSPTSIACEPDRLSAFLRGVEAAIAVSGPMSARVAGAHLESNFINPDYRGAQPLRCLRTASGPRAIGDAFTAEQVIQVIREHARSVSAVTLAPEIEGGLALVSQLVDLGIRVSLGHSGATLDEGCAGIAAGATRATHLFNRMSPMTHRDPGLPGAVLASDAVSAEIICDGRHVHPAVVRFAIGAKGIPRVLAITDGTAGSGLATGARTVLGGQPVTVSDVARLDDGTMAGSVATMNQVFGFLLTRAAVTLVDAARMCSTNPAAQLHLTGRGRLAAGAAADVTVLRPDFAVAGTWIDGRRVYSG